MTLLAEPRQGERYAHGDDHIQHHVAGPHGVHYSQLMATEWAGGVGGGESTISLLVLFLVAGVVVTNWFKIIAPICVRRQQCRIQQLLECHVTSITVAAIEASQSENWDGRVAVVAFGCLCALINKPALRPSAEV